MQNSSLSTAVKGSISISKGFVCAWEVSIYTSCPNTLEKLRKTLIAVLTILAKASSEMSESTSTVSDLKCVRLLVKIFGNNNDNNKICILKQKGIPPFFNFEAYV